MHPAVILLCEKQIAIHLAQGLQKSSSRGGFGYNARIFSGDGKMPFTLKKAVQEIFASAIGWPLARR